MTIGQAFDLAYSRYFEPGSRPEEVGHDSQLERQNDILRRRVVELSALIESRKLSAYLSSNGVICLLFAVSPSLTPSRTDLVRSRPDELSLDYVVGVLFPGRRTDAAEGTESSRKWINVSAQSTYCRRGPLARFLD